MLLAGGGFTAARLGLLPGIKTCDSRNGSLHILISPVLRYSDDKYSILILG